MRLKAEILSKAEELGFLMCGFSRAEFMEPEARDLERWLREHRHGEMQYMENHFDKRTDPRLLVDGAKTVISVLHNYYPKPEWKQPDNAPRISKYAWGEDYHHVLKDKLHLLLAFIKEKAGDVNARVFVDSAPVLDKHWAKRSGLGWIGKNTNLIHPKTGSFFFIGEIILDLEIEPDGPMKDYCGTCTRCIDACPTEALEPYRIDARKCISYLTIELKKEIPETFHGKMENWAYGCDICQDVCPWNSFSLPEMTGAFTPLPHMLTFTKKEWEEVTADEFGQLTKKTAMSRVKWEKWRGNVRNVVDEQDGER